MDLDGFKSINDTMGHNTGDLILQWAADRLQKGIRPDDMVSRVRDGETEVELARLGGDEFTALIPCISKPEEALIVAHRIRELMRRPFLLDGREVVLTASIGIALYPEDGEDADSLLKHADTAMYHAKDKGRDNCQFYSASLTQRVQQRLNLESNLRQALSRNEFSLVYQPQLDLSSGRIHSIEALIRWNHPEQGVISPMDFIPLAEENGMIVPIGEWVLRTACIDAARWQHAGHGLRVAVNLSPMQFKDSNLVKTVLDILAQTGLAPKFLELEVTEGAVMENSGATLATLEALSTHGVQIALDDFGTGYSSMNYLKRMPLNNLKVDQSFVQGLPHDRDNHAIVRAILSLAQNLGFSVTAEGVETREQAETLKNLACDTLQGFYFSRPVPAADIPGLLTRQWRVHDLESDHASPIFTILPA
jgi:diguanylate cyclase (GGDEF)-like protein